LEAHIERELRSRVPREEFKVTETRNDSTFIIKGKNVSARIQIDDHLLTIALDLPLLFVPFRSRIESGIRDVLKNV